MTLTVRIEKRLEQALGRAAREEGVTRSEMLRRCLEEFLARRKSSRVAWELGKDLFGKLGSGRSDLSADRKQVLREKIRAAKGHRRFRRARRPV